MAANGNATTSDDWELQRDEAKALGDTAFRSRDYEQAIQHYSTALSIDPENAKLLSNRSAAYLQNNQKSKALHDAQKCVSLKTMGVKGQSRLAAALQALGRFEPALEQWQSILKDEPQHAAALKGVSDCQTALEEMRIKEEAEQKQQQTTTEQEDGGEDDLDDFFNDVDEATEAVAQQKREEAKEKPTEAIKSHKKDLGTAKDQIARLLATNYRWRNLNPFYVLDISHTASEEDISRRYKALSLLLHPDKNRDDSRAQDAYDEVLQAKAKLNDENKANHVRQLVEQGMKQGKLDWEKRPGHDSESLEDFQSRAVQRIFAQVEHKRQEVEERHRKQEQRERDQEEEELEKERESRKFDKGWKQEERVDKRIGNWRDFRKKGAKKAKQS